MVLAGLLASLAAVATSAALQTRPVSENQLRSAAPTTPGDDTRLALHFGLSGSEMKPKFLTRPSGKMQRRNQDVTMVTQGTLSRVDAFETALLAWMGPASVVFYLEDQDQVAKLTEKSSGWNETVVQYVLATKGQLYPVNALRNMAMDAAETEYVFLADMDFISDKKAYESIRLHLPGDREALVLPGFELGKTGFDPESVPQKDLPADKDMLKGLVDKGLAREFHISTKKKLHGPTNFSRWWSETDEGTYDIPSSSLNDSFEPYVVARKASLPRFDERFEGRGYDKISFFYKLQCMGFQFRVLQKHFVAHMPHSFRPYVQQTEKNPNSQTWKNFKEDLNSTGQCPHPPRHLVE